MTASWIPKGACAEGVASVGEQSLREWWMSTDRADWMVWVLNASVYSTRAAAYDAARAAYAEVRADSAYACAYAYAYDASCAAADAASSTTSRAAFWRSHSEVADRIRGVVSAEQVAAWLGVSP
jgi:hypothetical protein